MFSAIEISKWFLAKNFAESKTSSIDGEYEGISPLKMQKLLYYAQGIHLALNNAPLFKENIDAWQHGPVVNSVYQEYKNCGSNFITPVFTDKDENLISAIENDSTVLESLELAYNNFAIFTAWQLRNMTHVQGSPWDITTNTTGTGATIDNNLIKEYFLENVFEEN